MISYFATLDRQGVLQMDADPLAMLGGAALSPAEQAVIVSLYSDAPAQEGDALPDTSGDRRGWWGDTYATTQGDHVGSRLWLLRRAKASVATAQLAAGYAQEALAWLVTSGLATDVAVVGTLVAPGRVDIEVTIGRAKTGASVLRFAELWGA